MGVCLGIYFNAFTLTHALGFDSLRYEWDAPTLPFFVIPRRSNVCFLRLNNQK
jgi:hypothetical protein